MATTETSPALERVPNLSGGKWAAAASQRTSEVFNPSTGHAIAEVALSSAQETNDVVQVAASALATDRRTSARHVPSARNHGNAFQ